MNKDLGEFGANLGAATLERDVFLQEIFLDIIGRINPIGTYLDPDTLVSSLGGINSITRADLIKKIEKDIHPSKGLGDAIDLAVRRSFMPFLYDEVLKQMKLGELLAIPHAADILIERVQSLESHEKLVLKQLLRQSEELPKES